MRQQKTTGEQRWVLGLTAIGSMVVALDTLVVAAALTTIRQDLGASIEQLEWTVNAYASFDAGITRAVVVCGVLSLAGALTGLGITARRRVEVRV